MNALRFAQDEKKLPTTEQKALIALREKGIFVDAHDDQQRIYPNQTLAAHVLGYVQTERPLTNGQRKAELLGKEGIEFSFDSRLRGTRGWRVTERDRDRREPVNLRH